MNTKSVLRTFALTSTLYLLVQLFLALFSFWANKEKGLNTFFPQPMYLIMPIVSMVLVGVAFVIMRRHYTGESPRILLYSVSFLLLYMLLMIPPFMYGLNIIFTTWTFVMSVISIGCIVFQEYALLDVSKVPYVELKFVYEELKYLGDKLVAGFLTLGSVLAVCMTILWTAPMDSFKMTYDERVFWAVYMVFCFFEITLQICFFIVFPSIEQIKAIKIELWILRPNTRDQHDNL